VYDDGIGFRPPSRSTPGAETGLGILGMQERAMLVGARFSILSTPRVGTVVRVVVPDPSLPPLGAWYGVNGTFPRVVTKV
jgi:signal transduction histidine kinase